MENQNSFIEKINAKRKSKTKSVLLLCGIFIVLFLLSWMASSWYSKQAIKTIRVSGNTVLTAGEINAIIDEKIMNIPNEGIELNAVKNKIIAHEYVEDAYVWFNSKGVLGIEIKERVPVGLVVKPDGEIVFVDQTGAIFKYRLYKEYTDLPVISNVYGRNAKNIDKVVLSGALDIITELQSNFPKLNNIVSEVKFNTLSKNYELYLTESGIKVDFGRAENIAHKMEKIYIFWKEKISTVQDRNEFRNIDVKWNNVVIVRRSQMAI
jgi:cell division septal protein FtsQ